MARQFKLVVERNGDVESKLFVHDDNTLELVDADSGKEVNYLTEKLSILEKTVMWARKNNVHKFSLTDVSGE